MKPLAALILPLVVILTGCPSKDGGKSAIVDALLRDVNRGLPVSYEYNLGQADRRYRTPRILLADNSWRLAADTIESI